MFTAHVTRGLLQDERSRRKTMGVSLLFSLILLGVLFFFFSSRRRHTRSTRDWSSDVCSSDLLSGTGVRHWRRLCGWRREGVARSRPRARPRDSPRQQPGRNHPPRRVHPRHLGPRSEERRVGKSVELGGRRRINKKNTAEIELT